jgi:hypothetical protein
MISDAGRPEATNGGGGGLEHPVGTSSQQEHSLTGHTGAVLCFTMLDDKLLFSGSADCTIKARHIPIFRPCKYIPLPLPPAALSAPEAEPEHKLPKYKLLFSGIESIALPLGGGREPQIKGPKGGKGSAIQCQAGRL